MAARTLANLTYKNLLNNALHYKTRLYMRFFKVANLRFFLQLCKKKFEKEHELLFGKTTDKTDEHEWQ